MIYVLPLHLYLQANKPLDSNCQLSKTDEIFILFHSRNLNLHFILDMTFNKF
jgi:hypothetical protein